MGGAVALAVVVLAVLLLIGGTIAALRVGARRSRAWQLFAEQHGWRFSGEDQELTRRWIGGPFGVGSSRRAYNVLAGSAHGRECLVFEYSLRARGRQPGGSSLKHQHRFAVVALRLDAPLPAISCGYTGRPEAGAPSAPEPGLELEWDEFNRRFRVRTDDPRYGYAMLGSRTMVRLMQEQPESWWIEDGWILIAGPWPQGPDDVTRRLDTLSAIVDLVPDFVWRDYGHVDPAQLPGRADTDGEPA